MCSGCVRVCSGSVGVCSGSVGGLKLKTDLLQGART